MESSPSWQSYPPTRTLSAEDPGKEFVSLTPKLVPGSGAPIILSVSALSAYLPSLFSTRKFPSKGCRLPLVSPVWNQNGMPANSGLFYP